MADYSLVVPTRLSRYISAEGYLVTYLDVRSILAKKYNDLPRVTLPIFSTFSPSALMLMILKTNQYSSDVLFIT